MPAATNRDSKRAYTWMLASWSLKHLTGRAEVFQYFSAILAGCRPAGRPAACLFRCYQCTLQYIKQIRHFQSWPEFDTGL
jgi:hypothetical protein